MATSSFVSDLALAAPVALVVESVVIRRSFNGSLIAYHLQTDLAPETNRFPMSWESVASPLFENPSVEMLSAGSGGGQAPIGERKGRSPVDNG
jgi:hypothetical protein